MEEDRAAEKTAPESSHDEIPDPSETTPAFESANESAESPGGGKLARLGLAIADWSQRWFPDAFVFALLALAIAFCMGLLLGESPLTLAVEAGKGFWVLVPFTMQMVMMIIGGYAVASSPPVHRLIERLASVPKTPRAAITMVALFSTTSSLLSWGLSLIFSGLLIRAIVKRLPGVDYRAIGAAGYLGLGSVWALGLSSSAALMMASRESLPKALVEISGVIPLTQTIFLWQSIVMALVLIITASAVASLSAPSGSKVRTVKDFGITFEKPQDEKETVARPGEWLEHSPVLTVLVTLILAAYLVNLFRTSPQGPLAALDLSTYNLIFIVLAMVLHWRPRRFLKAVADAVPATGGVLIQFPFYAAIFGIITGTKISGWLAHIFVSVTTQTTYPLLVALYSSILGVFIPSGGSKWIIEAPYLLKAASIHQVHLGWVVQIYNASEALPNLVNPFWMLPMLGLLKVKAKDLVGYAIVQLMIQAPIVFLLCWLFARTLQWVPPSH